MAGSYADNRACRRRVCAALVALVGALSAGCDDLQYVLHVAEGQLAVQGGVEAIADVLGSGRLTAEEEE